MPDPAPELIDFDAEAGLLLPLGLAVSALGKVVVPLRTLTHSEVPPVAAAADVLLDRIGGLTEALAAFTRELVAEKERRKVAECPNPLAN